MIEVVSTPWRSPVCQAENSSSKAPAGYFGRSFPRRFGNPEWRRDSDGSNLPLFTRLLWPPCCIHKDKET
jgi:hypothetical protein